MFLGYFDRHGQEIIHALGWEGDLAATFVTPLITTVDSANLAGQAGVPFLPHCSRYIPPEAAQSVKEDDLPQ